MPARRLVEISLEFADQVLQPRGIPWSQQKKVLRKLLKKAVNTEFGRHYNFRKILDTTDFSKTFQEVVPLFDYTQLYDQWWIRTLAGKPGITWPGKVKYYALSSGTSNATSKRIPVTRAMLRALQKAALRLFTNLAQFTSEEIYDKSFLGIGGTSRMAKVDGHFEGYLSGINARKRPFWARGIYRPGDQITEITDFDTRTDVIAQHATEWDVGVIIGIPHWIQLTMERILALHNVKTLKEIWPHLKIVVSGGVDFRPYRRIIDTIVGHPLIYIDTFLASEGMIAFQTEPDSKDLQLYTDGGIFFEFIPFENTFFDDEGDLIGTPPVETIETVMPGREYAVVISTCAGAWRYLLGDTIRFTDPKKGLIRIVGRTKYYLNLCTEHLTGDNMVAAISQAEEKLGIVITEYTIAPVKKGNYFGHHWFVGVEDLVDTLRLKEVIDSTLGSINDDYRTERATVLSMELEILPLSYFHEWLTVHARAPGQSKMPRVIKGEALRTWLEFLALKKHDQKSD